MSIKIQNKKLVKSFNKKKFNFKKIFSEYLLNSEAETLSQIHLNLDKKYIPKEIMKEFQDQNSLFYEVLYGVDPGYNLVTPLEDGIFLKTYKELISYISDEIFNEKIIYQAKPTLRIQFPNNKAVGGWHRDRDYNHPIEEINFWVPVTEACNTNSIWIESSFNKQDFSPVNIPFGKMLIFDSGLMHGNKINTENKTRISFDFRVIPLSKYSPKQLIKKSNLSIAQQIEFSIGKYYGISN
tara:strand:+ start:310 stop:1026 length:717 start_codon:yes stop_codon:yes gene_type:complete